MRMQRIGKSIGVIRMNNHRIGFVIKIKNITIPTRVIRKTSDEVRNITLK
jgi:hypothetical protein